MISGEPLEIRQAKAQALREAADAIRSTEVMFLDADGSAIKVNDLLREMATDHLRPGVSALRAVVRDLAARDVQMSDSETAELLWDAGVRVEAADDR